MFLSKGVGLLRPILLFLLNEGISGMESDASQNKTEHLFMFIHNGLKHESSFRKKSFFWYVKFELSEKHTKFEKIFLIVLKNQLIYLGSIHITRQMFGGHF